MTEIGSNFARLSMNFLPVAQIANLLFRRLPVGWVLILSSLLKYPHALPIRCHADCQSATQQTGSLRYDSEPEFASTL